jgi:hypothetical protein
MKHLLVVTGVLILATGCSSTHTNVKVASGQSHVYVCHGDKQSRWIRVAAPAARAHRRHGDRVTESPHEPSVPCRN